ncbi:hypothetical protein LGM65_31240 [Burkholderia anthina]|nr:hypothetical protein [Burkholderia anthina]MCA8095297.1 hypothetical protein [Burkholderia anthina]
MPLPKVHALSLENHLALATIRAGHGDFDQNCCLVRVVYFAYFMRNGTAAGKDVEPYHRAEAALDACVRRVGQDQPCLLLDHEQTMVERVLAVHDDRLAAVPKHHYLAAWDRLQRFVTSRACSPIPLAEGVA